VRNPKEEDELSESTTIQSRSVAATEVQVSNLDHLREVVADLINYRGLLYQLTLRDIKIRYKQAAMGFGWAIFLPAIIVLAGLMVRFAMAMLSGTGLQGGEIAGMAVKAVPWAFFMGAINFAVASLTGNLTLVSKIYFPREVMPISSVMAQGWDSTIGAIAIIVLLPFLGVWPHVQWLWGFPLTILLVLFTAATALFLSCANLFFRDVKYIVQVLLTFGIFFTPVFFEPYMFGELGAQLMMLNPVAPILEGYRLALIEGHNLAATLHFAAGDVTVLAWTPWYLAYTAVWAIGGLIGAALMFHRLEFLFAEYV
jgi:lipopolysaccharide transport system permease protein